MNDGESFEEITMRTQLIGLICYAGPDFLHVSEEYCELPRSHLRNSGSQLLF